MAEETVTLRKRDTERLRVIHRVLDGLITEVYLLGENPCLFIGQKTRDSHMTEDLIKAFSKNTPGRLVQLFFPTSLILENEFFGILLQFNSQPFFWIADLPGIPFLILNIAVIILGYKKLG